MQGSVEKVPWVRHLCQQILHEPTPNWGLQACPSGSLLHAHTFTRLEQPHVLVCRLLQSTSGTHIRVLAVCSMHPLVNKDAASVSCNSLGQLFVAALIIL